MRRRWRRLSLLTNAEGLLARPNPDQPRRPLAVTPIDKAM